MTQAGFPRTPALLGKDGTPRSGAGPGTKRRDAKCAEPRSYNCIIRRVELVQRGKMPLNGAAMGHRCNDPTLAEQRKDGAPAPVQIT
jgi:hypothetical protein